MKFTLEVNMEHPNFRKLLSTATRAEAVAQVLSMATDRLLDAPNHQFPRDLNDPTSIYSWDHLSIEENEDGDPQGVGFMESVTDCYTDRARARLPRKP